MLVIFISVGVWVTVAWWKQRSGILRSRRFVDDGAGKVEEGDWKGVRQL